MLRPVDLTNARCVVELGPGNGCVTREILARLPPDTLGVNKVDAVVSSLLLSLLPNATVASILASVGLILEQGGQFLQCQYSLPNYAELKPLFRKVRLSFTLGNVPSAFVYDCLK